MTPWNLTDRSIVWSSSDEKIATVDANGVVTAVSEGTAVITAASKLDGTVKAECTITVMQNNTTLTGIVHNADGQSFVADIDVDSANYKYLTGALEQGLLLPSFRRAIRCWPPATATSTALMPKTATQPRSCATPATCLCPIWPTSRTLTSRSAPMVTT